MINAYQPENNRGQLRLSLFLQGVLIGVSRFKPISPLTFTDNQSKWFGRAGSKAPLAISESASSSN
ncbi:hypothetical protein P3S68_031716 [Capsicum galapagoense]